MDEDEGTKMNGTTLQYDPLPSLEHLAEKDLTCSEDSISQQHSSAVRLKKELGVLEGVGVIVGVVVGSGIFVSPKGVLQYSGSVGTALLIWVAGGLFSMVGALCFAELGTMIPESGGMYVYLGRAFGPVMSFLYMWVTTLTRNSAGTAVIALTFGQYLVQLIRPCTDVHPALPPLLATMLVCLLTYINCVRVKWVNRLTNVFAFTKLAALLVIIISGIVHLAQGHTQNLERPFSGSGWTIASLPTAFYHCLFSYTGWDYLNLVTEELKNPNRNLPLAIILSTTVITVVYTLANLAYFAVLTTPEMLASDAVVMSFASRILGSFALVMPVFVVLATFGSVHSCVFTQCRLIFAGARQGHFPAACNLINTKNHTPIPAALVNGLTILVMLTVPDISLLINYTSYSATLMQFACMCALFWFRYKHPEWERPFKVGTVLPVLFVLSQVLLLVLPIVMTPGQVGGAIVITIVGLPVYYLAIHRQDIARLCARPLDEMTLFCQKLFLCLPEDKND